MQHLNEFGQFGEPAEHARPVDDEFADRVHHAVEPLERNAHGFGLRQSLRRGGARGRRNRRCPDRERFHSGRSFGFTAFLGCFFGRELRDSREQRINGGGHFGIARPLAVEKLLEHIHGLEEQVHDLGAGLQHAVAQASDHIFDAMGHRGEPVQTDLRGGAFDGVHRAKQAIDLVRVGISLEREQAFGDRLQMFLGFGNEELEHFVGDFAILREAVRERSGREDGRNRFASARRVRGRLVFRFRRRRRGKRERIALLESDNIGGRFRAARTDLQEIELEYGNRVGQKFRERAVHVGRQRRVHGVVKDVRHFRGDFGKLREAVARRRARERVRSDVELFEILRLGLRLLQKPGVLPQILEVLGSLLEEQLDRFLIGPVHRAPSTRAGARRASTAPGLR